MIKIDKDVPFPATKGFRLYPWAEMEIGDSFFLAERTYKSMHVHCSVSGKKHNKKFRCAEVEGGVRVWRIA